MNLPLLLLCIALGLVLIIALIYVFINRMLKGFSADHSDREIAAVQLHDKTVKKT